MRHKLAELKTEVVIARTFVDNCIALHSEHRLDSQMASMAERSPPMQCTRARTGISNSGRCTRECAVIRSKLSGYRLNGEVPP